MTAALLTAADSLTEWHWVTGRSSIRSRIDGRLQSLITLMHYLSALLVIES